LLAAYVLLSGHAPYTRNAVFLIPLVCVLAAQAAARAVKPGPLAERAALLCAAGLFAWSAATTYGVHRAFMRNPHFDTHALFQQRAGPLHRGAGPAAPAALLVPITLYARIEGSPLTRVRNLYELSIAQRTEPGAPPIRSLSRPGQRFWLLAWTDADRKLVPN